MLHFMRRLDFCAIIAYEYVLLYPCGDSASESSNRFEIIHHSTYKTTSHLTTTLYTNKQTTNNKMPKTIAILNATGNQGSGLIRALLAPNSQNNDYKVRALTRNTTSPAAEELQSIYGPSRLELVQADIYDADSLRKAFKDVDGVFAATNNRLPGKKIETEDETRHELVAGWNIVDAARVPLPYFLFPCMYIC